MQTVYGPLEFREVFHLEFLRRLGGKLEPKFFCLKGGANLRFFSEASAIPKTSIWTSPDIPLTGSRSSS